MPVDRIVVKWSQPVHTLLKAAGEKFKNTNVDFGKTFFVSRGEDVAYEIHVSRKIAEKKKSQPIRLVYCVVPIDDSVKFDADVENTARKIVRNARSPKPLVKNIKLKEKRDATMFKFTLGINEDENGWHRTLPNKQAHFNLVYKMLRAVLGLEEKTPAKMASYNAEKKKSSRKRKAAAIEPKKPVVDTNETDAKSDQEEEEENTTVFNEGEQPEADPYQTETESEQEEEGIIVPNEGEQVAQDQPAPPAAANDDVVDLTGDD